MFQTLIFDAYDDVYTDQIDLPRFNCSPGFISDFKIEILFLLELHIFVKDH